MYRKERYVVQVVVIFEVDPDGCAGLNIPSYYSLYPEALEAYKKTLPKTLDEAKRRYVPVDSIFCEKWAHNAVELGQCRCPDFMNNGRYACLINGRGGALEAAHRDDCARFSSPTCKGFGLGLYARRGPS